MGVGGQKRRARAADGADGSGAQCERTDLLVRPATGGDHACDGPRHDQPDAHPLTDLPLGVARHDGSHGGHGDGERSVEQGHRPRPALLSHLGRRRA